MKKKILIILAIIFITLIAVLYFSFGKQYKAASSVHLVSDGMGSEPVEKTTNILTGYKSVVFL